MEVMGTNGGGRKARRPYDHARLERRRWILRWMIREIGFRILVKLDTVSGLENLPAQGPAILMINHIAFVDPVVVLGCLPRNIVPMAKVEVFRYPVWGVFPKLWEVIPVHRGEMDRAALRTAMEVLGAGEVILVAPEGTRSVSLQRGKEGVAFLGYRSGAPIIPVAVEGTQGFPSPDPRRWWEPGAQIRLGRAFRYRRQVERPGREQLRRMTDEAMYVLAAMLPEARRGVYSDLSAATRATMDFA